MVLAGVRIDRRSRLRPGQAPIGRPGNVNVELVGAVVLPNHVQVAVGAVLSDPREVVGADESARDALFPAPPEVALRLTDDDVGTDLDGPAAVEVRAPGRRTSHWATVHSELLGVGIIGSGIPIVEGDLQVAVGQRDRVRSLVEVARRSWSVECRRAEADRRRATYLLRCRPGDAVVGGHRAIDWRASGPAEGVTRNDFEYRPGDINVVSIGTACEGVRCDELLVVEDVRVVVLGDHVGPA